ncbi:MAG: Hsp20/alpha crystallin family protein [Dehalococcoidia bacterium]
MLTLVRWDPFRRLEFYRRDLDRRFEEPFAWAFRLPYNGNGLARLTLDVYQTDDSIVVKAGLPEIDPKDIKITIDGYRLTIEGETRHEDEPKDRDYLVRERRDGAFRRTVTLPEGVDADRAEAVHEGGVLTLTIPKAEAAKVKTIHVETKERKGGKAKA